MSSIENIATLITIVFGLILTDLFASLHRLIRRRRLVRWHWLPLLVAWYVLAVVLKNWYGLVFDSDTEAWSSGWVFFYFGHLLLLLYLLASAALPDEVPPEGLDLRGYYFDNARYFWGLLAGVNILLIVMAFVRPLLMDTAINWTAVIGNLVMMAVLFSLGGVRRYAYHVVVVLLLVAFLGLEVVSKF